MWGWGCGRHSREGGNPGTFHVFPVTCEATANGQCRHAADQQTQLPLEWREVSDGVTAWIPAFAGMTVFVPG